MHSKSTHHWFCKTFGHKEVLNLLSVVTLPQLIFFFHPCDQLNKTHKKSVLLNWTTN